MPVETRERLLGPHLLMYGEQLAHIATGSEQELTVKTKCLNTSSICTPTSQSNCLP